MFGSDGSNVSQYLFRPEDQAALSGYLQRMQGALGGVRDLSGGVNTNFAQYAPNLNTEFKPGAELDNVSKQIVSQGQDRLAAERSGRDAAIASRFAATNPGLANVLRTQNAFHTAAAGNPLSFAALQQQHEREANAFQLTNAARLAASQQGANLAQLGNAAIGQQAQLSQLPLQSALLAAAGQSAASALRGQKQALTLEEFQKQGGGGPGGQLIRPQPAPVRRWNGYTYI